MNKTVNINLAGIIFHVDETAYEMLTDYLYKIKSYLLDNDSKEEILHDVESRIAELFSERLSGTPRQVIGTSDVTHIIDVMGAPEAYKIDDEAAFESEADFKSSNEFVRGERKFFRNREDRILAGVASGVAAYFAIDPLWIRLLFVLGTFFGGPGLLVYIILWIIIPEAKTTAQKLQMRGEPVNFANIEKKIKAEMRDVESSVKSFANSTKVKESQNAMVGGLQRTVDFFIEAFTRFFQFILRIIGVLLIIAASVILVFGIGLIWDGNFVFNDSSFVLSDFREHFESMLLTSLQINMLATSLIMIVISPIVLLILLGARILFNYRLQNKALKTILYLLPAFGFLGLIWTGISIGREYRVGGSVIQQKELPKQENQFLYLHAERLPDDSDLPWHIHGEQVLFKMVKINIKQTNASEPGIELKRVARGRTSENARINANNADYQFEITDSLIMLDPYFKIIDNAQKGPKFRSQRVEIVLYLPVGYQVYLSEELQVILGQVPLATGYKPRHELVGNTYIMTRNGLLCNSCLFEDAADLLDDDAPSASEKTKKETRKMQKLREKQEKLERALEELKDEIQDLN
jgi:phage shock protein PspC (stress-responsive transcriptional regulator)